MIVHLLLLSELRLLSKLLLLLWLILLRKLLCLCVALLLRFIVAHDFCLLRQELLVCHVDVVSAVGRRVARVIITRVRSSRLEIPTGVIFSGDLRHLDHVGNLLRGLIVQLH